MTAPVSLPMMVQRETATSGVPVRDAGSLRALVRRRHTPVPTGRSGVQEHQMVFTRGSTLRSTMEYLTRELAIEKWGQ